MPPLSPFTRSCIALAISNALALPTNAATITVNSNTDDGTGCTLREAIVSINSGTTLEPGCTNSGDPLGTNDNINFLFGDPGANTITLTQGELSIASGANISIDGSGVEGLTINPGGSSRAIYIKGETVALSNLTISGGSADYGGGLYIYESTSVSLTNCTLSSNTASSTGGAIYAVITSNIILDNTTLTGNTAIAGGGIYAKTVENLSITNSQISQNEAEYGGGVHAERYVGGLATPGNVTLTDTTVSENIGTSFAGGIYTSYNNLSLINTTVSANSSAAGGGVVAIYDSLSLTNSTVSGNSASDAGGIYAFSNTVTLNNSTVTGNSAAQLGGGVYTDRVHSVNLINSLIAGNRALTGGEIWDDGLNSTVFVSSGVNLLGDKGHDSATAFFTFSPNLSDITATADGKRPTALSRILLPLADNGGPTLTHALGVSSPAIDAGRQCQTTDQRGEERRINVCDIGAYEAPDNSSKFVLPTINGGAVVIEL